MNQYQAVPFTPIKFLRSSGLRRRFTVYWLLLSFLVLPAVWLTSFFDLVGIPYTLLGLNFHITIYLPLVFLIPCALIFGFYWGAVPAYIYTFSAAMIGNMSLDWAILFAFSDPIGLAILCMIYRVIPARLDLRSLPAALLFILSVFLFAITSSIGSFIWSYTNQIGLNDFFIIWQGWWLGSFIQASVVLTPMLLVVAPYLIHIRNQLTIESPAPLRSQHAFKIAISMVVMIITLYIWLTFMISLNNIEAKLTLVNDVAVKQTIFQATQVFIFPTVVLSVLIIFFGYFTYYYTHLTLSKQRIVNDELMQQNKLMYHISIHDSLTGIHNRAYLFSEFPKMITESKQQGFDLYLLMLDLDDFKNINDQYGHQAGDIVLKGFAENTQKLLNENMLFARFGGEEFSVVVTAINFNEVQKLAQKIIDSTRLMVISHEQQQIHLTTSIGVCALSNEIQSMDEMIGCADKALYQAKIDGRDQIVWFKS